MPRIITKANRLTEVDKLTIFAALLDSMQHCNRSEQRELLLDVVKRNPFIKGFLRRVYDPFTRHYITSADAAKTNPEKGSEGFLDILDKLAMQRIGVELAAARWHWKSRRLIGPIQRAADCLLDKSVGWKITRKDINKIFTLTGSEPLNRFSIAQGVEWSGKLPKGPYYISELVKGIRCIAIIREPHNPELYAADGGYLNHECEDYVWDALSDYGGTRQIVLDGAVTDEGIYRVFDALTFSEFCRQFSVASFDNRIKRIKYVLGKLKLPNVVEAVDQFDGTKFARIEKMAEKFEWAGMVLRLNKSYVGKQTNDIQVIE